MEQRPLDGWGKGGILSQLFRLCDDRGLHSSAPAGVDRSGRGCNPRPARGGLHSSAPAGVDRSGRGFNPRPAQEVRGAGVGLAPRRRK